MGDVFKKYERRCGMIFSISEHLGFSDEEILQIFREDIEITAIREPLELTQTFSVQGN